MYIHKTTTFIMSKPQSTFPIISVMLVGDWIEVLIR
nr:MAG TPA: hypothetical protein [Caudoviricetes sp.]